MPAPSSATYSATAKVNANTSFRDLLDSGSGAALVRLRDNADVLLAEGVLTDPCGTVNGTTGQLTITVATNDASANASGVATYCELCTSAGAVHLSLPTQSGTVAVSGFAVMNTTNIVATAPVSFITITVG